MIDPGTPEKALSVLGKTMGAEGMVQVKNAHVSGVSYMNLGKHGLEFLRDLAKSGARVSVPTSSNPCGVDVKSWKEQGITQEFLEHQLEVNKLLESMGVFPSYSCTFPYEGPWASGLSVGDHVAWAESSAVVYGNSVMGIRTNREGGPSALFAAIAGKTPAYGMHLDRNRRPALYVKIEEPVPRGPLEWGLLGKFVAERGQARVVYLDGLGRVATIGELKALSASLATYGPTDMFLAPHLTPEAGTPPTGVEELTVYGEELEGQARQAGDDAGTGNAPKAMFLGCPQYGVEELVYLARLLSPTKHVKGRLYVYASAHALSSPDGSEAAHRLRQIGVKIFQGTCPVFSPAPTFSDGVMTDSVKSWFYLPGSKGVKPKLEPTVVAFMLSMGELDRS